MQEKIRLEQMGRQNMISRKFRLSETDYSRENERKLSNTAKPKPHLCFTSKTVTSILILLVAGGTTTYSIPIFIKPRDQRFWFHSLNLELYLNLEKTLKIQNLISCFKFKKCCLGHLSEPHWPGTGFDRPRLPTHASYISRHTQVNFGIP